MFEVEDEVEAERAAMAARLARMSAASGTFSQDDRSASGDTDGSGEVCRSSDADEPAAYMLLSPDSKADLFALDTCVRAGEDYEVGGAVEARWRGGPVWYRGTVAAVNHANRSLTVAYNDGSVERHVAFDSIRCDGRAGRPRRSRSEVRAEIIAFYEEHNKAKVANVDTLLNQAGPGNEETLLDTIRHKYEERRAIRAELVAIYTAHNPAKLIHIDNLMNRSQGAEAALLAAVQRKYADAVAKARFDEDTASGVAQRRLVLEEMVLSEERFGASLVYLDVHFATPLRTLAERYSVASHEAPKMVQALVRLFGACDALRGLSKMLRDDLAQELRADGGNARLGKVFKRYGPFLKMFATYAQRFVETFGDARQQHDADATVRDFVSAAHADAAAGEYAGLVATALAAATHGVARGLRGAGVPRDPQAPDVETTALVEAPVLRVQTYEKLLSALVAHTPAGHCDHADSVAALAACAAAIAHVDATLNADVAFRRLLATLAATTGDRKAALALLDAPTVRLAREGKLQLVTRASLNQQHQRSSSTKRAKPPALTSDPGAPAAGDDVAVSAVDAYALSDRLLLVSTLTATRDPRRATVLHTIALDCEGFSTRASPREADLFQIISRPPLGAEKELTLRAASQQDRDAWLAALDALHRDATRRKDAAQHHDPADATRGGLSRAWTAHRRKLCAGKPSAKERSASWHPPKITH